MYIFHKVTNLRKLSLVVCTTAILVDVFLSQLNLLLYCLINQGLSYVMSCYLFSVQNLFQKFSFCLIYQRFLCIVTTRTISLYTIVWYFCVQLSLKSRATEIYAGIHQIYDAILHL